MNRLTVAPTPQMPQAPPTGNEVVEKKGDVAKAAVFNLPEDGDPSEDWDDDEFDDDESDVHEDIKIKVPVDQIDAWEKSIGDELKKPMYQLPVEEEPFITIPRVPKRLLYMNTDQPYAPRFISIGPYHQNKSDLKPMEKLKWKHLQAILSRNTQVSLKDYIGEIKALEVRARNCYSAFMYHQSKMFVQMLLLDGCFVVEYMLKKYAGGSSHLSGMMEDLLFHDLLLLENQLPFFVLQRIFDLLAAPKTSGENGSKGIVPSSLGKLVVNLFNQRFNTKKTGLPLEPVHHLLHFYHWFLLNSMPRPSEPNFTFSPTPPEIFKLKYCMGLVSSKKTHYSKPTVTATKKQEAVHMIPTAVELRKAGIKFKKRDVEGGSVFDVKFNDGVLEIPPLLIDAFTRDQFRNLVVFEHYHPSTEAKLTTYVMFLHSVMSTAEDVALLHENGIIQHKFCSNKVAASAWCGLTMGVFGRRTNYMSGLYQEVDEYLRELPRHRGSWVCFLRK